MLQRRDASNKKTARLLSKKVQVYLSPKMLHTKLVANEQVVSFGSCNITKKAFHQLDELNAFIKVQEKPLYDQLMQSVEQTIAQAQPAAPDNIKYNSFTAFLEGFLV